MREEFIPDFYNLTPKWNRRAYSHAIVVWGKRHDYFIIPSNNPISDEQGSLTSLHWQPPDLRKRHSSVMFFFVSLDLSRDLNSPRIISARGQNVLFHQLTCHRLASVVRLLSDDIASSPGTGSQGGDPQCSPGSTRALSGFSHAVLGCLTLNIHSELCIVWDLGSETLGPWLLDVMLLFSLYLWLP